MRKCGEVKKMKSGTRLSPGDLVLVPFPFTDLSSSKARPAVVFSGHAYNEASKDVLVFGVTSNLTNAAYSVLIRQQDMAEGRIMAPSRVKVDRVASLAKRIIRKRVARLDTSTFDEVIREFFAIFPRTG